MKLKQYLTDSKKKKKSNVDFWWDGISGKDKKMFAKEAGIKKTHKMWDDLDQKQKAALTKYYESKPFGR